MELDTDIDMAGGFVGYNKNNELNAYNLLKNANSDWNIYKNPSVLQSISPEELTSVLSSSINSKPGSFQNSTATDYLGVGLQGLGLLLNYRNNKKQLDIARQSLNNQINTSKANFASSATNQGNQTLARTQMLSDFNQAAGAKAAQDQLAGMQQLQSAGSSLGIGDTVGKQINQLQKYAALA